MTFGSEEQAKQKQAQASSPETEWQIPRHRGFPRYGQQVEFITTFGVRHLGIVLSVSNGLPKDPGRGHGIPEIILMSESVNPSEYFSIHQIEKWRNTNELVKKKRFLGSAPEELLAHLGLQSPVFVGYTFLRLTEKLAEEDYKGRIPQAYDTKHYKNEDGLNQWETSIVFSNKYVTLVEVEGNEKIKINLTDQSGDYLFDYKEVAKAAELITDHLLHRNQDH
jgi:hypothetical protein